MTTKERDEYIASQLNAGVSLSDVQTKLAQEYGVKMTYFELRMLAMGLAVDWEKQDKPKPAAAPAPVVAAAPQGAVAADDGTDTANDAFDAEAEEPEAEPADDEEEETDDEEAAADGETKIVLDETPHPGAALSGTAVFASGASGKWALSRNGRLGFEPDEGSAEPDENDWQLFQAELQKTTRTTGSCSRRNSRRRCRVSAARMRRTRRSWTLTRSSARVCNCLVPSRLRPAPRGRGTSASAALASSLPKVPRSPRRRM